MSLTEDGLVVPTPAEIRDDINSALRSAFGASIDVGDLSVFGILSGIVAERLGALWEALEATYSSQDIDKASGASLDALCLLTGTFRPPASYSTVDLVLTGTATTNIPVGSSASTASTEKAFLTVEETELVAVDAWDITETYAIGDRVTNGGNVYQCRTAGAAVLIGGPVTTPAYPDYVDENVGITEGITTLTWYWLGEGAAAADVGSIAAEAGAITAAAGDVLVIDNSLTGWQGVVNLLDAEPGQDAYTDEQLRILRAEEIATPGSAPIDAIIAELLQVPDVETVSVFENITDVTDGDGVPPHSIEALVEGGDDQDIWDRLLASVAAGIRTHGDEVGTSEDSEGTLHTMKFSRPTAVPIYVDILLVVDEDVYPADGDDQVAAAIVAAGEARGIGYDAIQKLVQSAAFSVAGVLDVTHCYMDDAIIAGTPTANVSISSRQRATWDTSRVAVANAPGTP